MKHKTLKQANALMALALFGSSAFASADKDLLDILMKNGALSKDQYNAMAGKEGMASAELLQALAKNGVITKAQYDSLNKKVPAKAEAPKTTVAANEAAGKGAGHDEKENAHVKLGDHGLEIESADGNFKFNMGGRIQVDSQVAFNDSRASNSLNALDANLNDGVGFRRARLHAEGTLYKDFDYKFEYDFVRAGAGQPASQGITDSWIEYKHFKPFSITVGQFKEPLSIESVTSNRFLTFIERSVLNNAFIENPNPYLLGISAQSYGDRWSARGAFQTEPIGGNNGNVSAVNPSSGNANRNNAGSGSGSWGATGRVTFLPYYNSPSELIHLGASGSYRNVNNKYNGTGLATNPMSFSSQPDTNFDRTAWANTGALTNNMLPGAGHKQLNDYVRVGGEFVGIYGPFQLVGEYMRTNLNGVGYSSDDHLDAWYTYGSYFLTGESRTYNVKQGKFDRQKIKHNFDMNGGWGAWEIAARWDSLDMNTPNINGGRLQNGTLALNWYLNNHVRFMADYVHVFNSSNQAPLAGIGKYNGLNPDIIEFRTQIDW